MKCPILSHSISYHNVDCLKEECAVGWDKETKQCVFLAFERIAKELEYLEPIAKALEKIAHHINVQIAK